MSCTLCQTPNLEKLDTVPFVTSTLWRFARVEIPFAVVVMQHLSSYFTGLTCSYFQGPE